jgi:hypothetical protein
VRQRLAQLPPRQRRLLALLAVAALAFIWLRVVPSLLPEGAGAGASRPAERARREALGDVVGLRLEDLEAQPGSYTAGRDPFRYGEPPPPPPPPPPTAEELAAEAARLAQERALQAERAAEAARPKPPPVNLRYLGSFGTEVRRIAVFSDGQNIYNARAGDVLDGKFIVARIGYESVDIGFVGFPDEPPQRLAAGG